MLHSRFSSAFVGTLALSAVSSLMLGCGVPEPEDDLGQIQSEVTVCPGRSVLQGIDVSYYQGSINWSQVKAAGNSFAIIRVSDGTGFMDPKFSANWSGSKSAGVVHGTYQFFRPGQSANAQADIVINNLRSAGFGSGDIPPVLDVEVRDGQSNATIVAGIKAWVSKVQGALGRKPIIYSSPSFWSGLGNPTISGARLWIAHWGVSCPNVPTGWTGWSFWQYSSTGKVPGIAGNVDLDRFNGTLADLKSL